MSKFRLETASGLIGKFVLVALAASISMAFDPPDPMAWYNANIQPKGWVYVDKYYLNSCNYPACANGWFFVLAQRTEGTTVIERKEAQVEQPPRFQGEIAWLSQTYKVKIDCPNSRELFLEEVTYSGQNLSGQHNAIEGGLYYFPVHFDGPPVKDLPNYADQLLFKAVCKA
jgi:hypothetical protein